VISSDSATELFSVVTWTAHGWYPVTRTTVNFCALHHCRSNRNWWWRSYWPSVECASCVEQHRAAAVKLWRTAMTGCFRTTRTSDFKASHSVADCHSEQTRYHTTWPSFRKSWICFLCALGCRYVMTASECIECVYNARIGTAVCHWCELQTVIIARVQLGRSLNPTLQCLRIGTFCC